MVNYASRSDMQRDRARERMERARRQWELEHADQQPPGAGPPGVSGGGAGAGGTGTTTLSGGGGGTNGGMNHISGAAGMPGSAGAPAAGVDTSVMDGGIPGFALV